MNGKRKRDITQGKRKGRGLAEPNRLYPFCEVTKGATRREREKKTQHEREAHARNCTDTQTHNGRDWVLYTQSNTQLQVPKHSPGDTHATADT